jgi:2-methylisocitrate lyase-like PEP mutase family enzyme
LIAGHCAASFDIKEEAGVSRGQDLTASLRAATTEPLLTPVIWDALSAQLAERAGFEAVWLGGSAVAAAYLGLPDAGVVTASDMESVLRHIVATSSVAVLVDADDGFGNYFSAMRTVRAMEAAGAAGLQIDDQFSHRTPVGNSTLVVSEDEAVGKIKAAADARKDDNFLIVARTDALWTLGINAAIDRANKFAEAGAQGSFISGCYTSDIMNKVGKEVSAPHRCLTKLPDDMSLSQIRAAGFDIAAIGQVDPLRAAALAMMRYFDDLAERKLDAAREFAATLPGSPVADWSEFTGLADMKRLDSLYASPEEYRQRYDPSARIQDPLKLP